MKKKVVLYVAAGLMAAGSGISGIASGDEQIAYKLEEMVVTATRHEETLSEVPAGISVITESDIDNSTAKDVADLLRSESGIHVNDITGGGRTYTVDLRGFGETAALNTLVLVDGRRTNQADLSGVDWAQIPLDRVERIEIIRGGRASALYGDNAAGGVINIITKKGDEFKAGGELQAGSYDTYKGSAYVRGSQDSLQYSISGSYKDTKGYRENSDNEVKDFGADFGYGLNDTLSVNISSGYHEDKAGLPGSLKDSDFVSGASRTDSMYPEDSVDYDDFYVAVGPEISFLSNSVIKLDTSYRKRNSTFYYTYTGGYYTGETDIATAAIAPHMNISENIFCIDQTLSLGMDYTDTDEDAISTSEYFGYAYSEKFEFEKENVGYYIHDDLSFSDSLSLSGGYRYDEAAYDLGYISYFEENPASITYDTSLYTVGLNYMMNLKSNIYVSLSKSYRYPVLDEFFSYMTYSFNSSLAPQESLDYEVGLRYALSDKTNAGFNLFSIRTESEIFYNPYYYYDIYYDYYSGANINMDGDTVRQGVEATLRRQFVWGQADLQYTFTETDIDGGNYDECEIPNVPKHQAGCNILVDYWKPVAVIINGRYVGERAYVSDWTNSLGKQGDYFVTDVKVKYAWMDMTAFININNILDEEYSEYGVINVNSLEKAYYPSPGRNFIIGISMAM